MKTYGQYCPIARAAEVFAERRTPIIVRNLHVGCQTFTAIQQGAPGIPTSLLAARLLRLTELGADSEAFVRWRLGQLPWTRAVAAGRIRATGPRELVRAFLSWGPLSRFAEVRPAQGTAAAAS